MGRPEWLLPRGSNCAVLSNRSHLQTLRDDIAHQSEGIDGQERGKEKLAWETWNPPPIKI